MKALADWYGMELCRLAVDHCLPIDLAHEGSGPSPRHHHRLLAGDRPDRTRVPCFDYTSPAFWPAQGPGPPIESTSRSMAASDHGNRRNGRALDNIAVYKRLKILLLLSCLHLTCQLPICAAKYIFNFAERFVASVFEFPEHFPFIK